MNKLLIISILSLSGCGYDPGGDLYEKSWLDKMERDYQSHKQLVINYDCDSRCSEQLIDDDVCLTSQASIGVHAATHNYVIDQAKTTELFNFYHKYPKFQARIIKDKAMSTLRIKVYTANEMWSFGVKRCV